MRLEYSIDNNIKHVDVQDDTLFTNGEAICLADKFSDITRYQNWYNLGYDLVNTKAIFDFKKVKNNIQNLIFKMISKVNKNLRENEFTLEKYHRFVDKNLHFEIIKKTRYLNISDFEFKSKELLEYVSNLIGTKVNWRSNGSYDPKIIIRINTPHSSNFNPAHKDVYQVYDETKHIPKMINLWVPICGVKERTGLPLALGSHLIPENKVLRTKAGIFINGEKYNVNCIKSWDQRNNLKTIIPQENQMIIFSSYLIHGLAKNYNEDETRISLEFRLFGDE
jgi:hypothetical protein